MVKASPRLLKPLRILRGHRKLFASLAAGFALYIILPEAWQIPTRVLVCWDSGAGLYLAITLADAAKVAQGTGGAAVTGTTQSFAITGNSDAGVVEHAAIVIAG